MSRFTQRLLTNHVAGLTRWTERHNSTDYLAWRTAHRFTATFESMLLRLW